MKVSFSNLQKKPREILQALDRNEEIVILYRGRPKAIMHPRRQRENPNAVPKRQTVQPSEYGQTATT